MVRIPDRHKCSSNTKNGIIFLTFFWRAVHTEEKKRWRQSSINISASFFVKDKFIVGTAWFGAYGSYSQNLPVFDNSHFEFAAASDTRASLGKCVISSTSPPKRTYGTTSPVSINRQTAALQIMSMATGNHPQKRTTGLKSYGQRLTKEEIAAHSATGHP